MTMLRPFRSWLPLLAVTLTVLVTVLVGPVSAEIAPATSHTYTAESQSESPNQGPGKLAGSAGLQGVPPVTVSFDHDTYLVREGQSATIAIVLNADPKRELVLRIKATNKLGASDTDYSGVPESVTFNSGETLQTFTFEAAEDEDDDAWETVEIGFESRLPDGMSVAAPIQTTVSIVDDAPLQLVSNMEEDFHFQVDVRRRELAQGFITGTDHSGYTITGASVDFYRLPEGTSENHFQLQLWPANSAGSSPAIAWHSQLGEFVNPDSLATGHRARRIFQARNDIHLDPGTRYYLVMRSTAGRSPRLVVTRDTPETTADGWTVDDQLSSRTTNKREYWIAQSNSIKISILGYAKPDQTAPTLAQATVNGTSLIMTYDEPLDGDSTPVPSTFAVRVNGRSNAVSSVSVDGATVTLALDTEISATDTATVSYSPPATNPVRDPAGHLAGSLVNHPVTHVGNIPEIVDEPTGLVATATYDSVTLTWDDPDDETITGYQVLRRDAILDLGNVYHVHVNDTGSASNTYIDKDVAPETSYVYRVRAWNTAGLSPKSRTAQIRTLWPPAELATTPAGAIDLGDITQIPIPQFYGYGVHHEIDPIDYFSFTITEPKEVQVGILGPDRDADLYVENSGNHILGRSEKPGTAAETVTVTLLAGTYFIRVQAREPGRNIYTLRYGVTDPDQQAIDALLSEPRSVSEPSYSDFAGDHAGSPYGMVLPGSPATANISTPDDYDVFNVSLERNRRNRFEVRGEYTGHGTLPNPRLWIGWPGDVDGWYDPDILTGGNPNAGIRNNERYEVDTALDGTEWRFRVSGNGGTGTYTLVLTDISYAIFTSPDRITVPENTTAVVTVVAEDVDDGETVSDYRIVGHLDHRHFSLTSPAGVLAFKNPPNYEHPRDHDRDNVYVVEVEATSGPDARQSYQRIEVTVADAPDPDDCASDDTTTCSVLADGTPAVGTIESKGDSDWFSVVMDTDKAYRIDVKGNNPQTIEDDEALRDPYLALYDASGDSIPNTDDDNGGKGNNARLTYTAVSSGTHYVEVRDSNRTAAGTYTVSVAPRRPDRPTGLSASSSNYDVVTLRWNHPSDPSVNGYQILRRDAKLHDLGAFLVHVEDTGSSATDYTDRDVSPETSYVYRIKARNQAGLSPISDYYTVRTSKAPANIDATKAAARDLGDITNLGEPKFPSFSINGDDDDVDYYRFVLTEPKEVELGVRKQDKDADLFLENEFGLVLESSERPDHAHEHISTTLLAGTYYIRVKAQETGINDYVLRYGVSNPDREKVLALLYPASTSEPHDSDFAGTHSGSPHGTVDPGSPATGNISSAEDRDVFRANTQRNRVYRFEVTGQDTEHGTLTDPRLWIGWPGDLDDWHDPDILTGGSPDAGHGKNELYEFDTAMDGTEWRFRVGGNGGTGTYTLVLTDISNAIFTSPDRITVPENTTAVVTVVAEDVDEGETVSEYRIVGHLDHRHFSITSPAGVLAFKNPSDYEQPRDGDRDNVYVVEVEATTGPDNRSSYQKILITVTDVDE